MKRLSRYVVEMDGSYYNTMTKVRLDLNSDESELKENLFLSGQENESLFLRLFKKPADLHLRILPTWECNLRCKHCSVLQNLKKKDPCKIVPDDVLSFCRAHMDRYQHKKINVSFIGGECLLEAKKCLEILNLIEEGTDAEVSSSLTSNFAMVLDLQMVDLLSRMTNFMVSLDGDEEQHNWQRKAFSGEINPYKKTVANLKRAIRLGFAEKMIVQAAVQDAVFDQEKKEKQTRELFKMGIKKIKYGSCHPTNQNPDPDKTYLENLKNPTIHSKPCCEYRYMNFFTINSNNDLYSEYYALENNFGHLSDFDFDNIEKLYRQKILENLSILKDDVCMNQCPVVAYCWGKCINNELYFEEFKNNPSKYCGREGLENRISDMAIRGEL